MLLTFDMVGRQKFTHPYNKKDTSKLQSNLLAPG